MKTGQASELLRRYCSQLELPAPQPEQLSRLAGLRKLTPGDFAAVIRQSGFRSIASTAALIAALEAECALKEGGSAGMGFFQ